MSQTEIAGVPPQYHDKAQRDGANQLGMWTLIATEVLFFGGLFLAYFVYRITYPAAFSAGSHLLDFWSGTVNTAVLLSSSLSMALADVMIKRGRRRAMAACIGCTAALGALFLAIKFHEYSEMYRDHLVPGINFSSPVAPQTELFIFLYFVMTGLHAVHMLIGIGVMAWLLRLNHQRRLTAAAHAPVIMVGLYWHFVDCVWVFLYPLLYLIPALK
jgi:cytochrome c oxidase subunit III